MIVEYLDITEIELHWDEDADQLVCIDLVDE